MSKKPEMTICRNCNTPMAKNAKICPSCGAKNTKPFYQKWWFLVLIIVLAVSALNSIGKSKKEKFDWKDVELCDRLPKPKSKTGSIIINDSSSLSMDVEKTTKSDYLAYIEDCQSMGYTVESEKEGNSYHAFNEEGYDLSLSHSDETMDIELDAPMEMGTLNWPKSKIAGLLPLPESTVGKVSYDRTEGCYIYVGETSIDDFTAYADKCTDCGFSVDYDKGDNYYRASDEKGNQLSLTYEGNQVMAVQIEKPEKTRKKKTAKKEKPAESEAVETEASEPAAVETEAVPESEPPAETKTPDNSAESADGMRPEFKAAMDSYEAFMNEYCDFMAKYSESDGTDLGLLADYTDYMSKYANVVKDFEAWDNGEMNTVEMAYYLDVQTRIEKRLLEVME